ncbi:MAG: tetratricopeptide repeat protein [Zoogloeaceae bacterium]|jgi:predicted O-linked N-acetylglucosamine transferase (SPINDLY family)/organic radical activating enzyme|nr:tetratricopeptide repeat protein [Zoogloeaceae bacterium]
MAKSTVASVGSLIDKGRKALAKRQYEEAGAFFEEVVTKSPKAHEAWFGLGEVALAVGQTEAAVTFLEEATKLKPEKVDYLLKLGDVYRQVGQGKERLKVLQAARRLKPRDSEVMSALSGAYVQLGNWQQAEKILREVVRLPDPLSAHFCLLGIVCQQLGKPDEALIAFQQATAKAPRYPDAWVSLGHLYLQKQENRKLEECLGKLFELDSTSSETLALAGDFEWSRGNVREAANFFRHAANSAPNDAPIQAKLAITLVMCGDSIAAIDAMERAHELGVHEDWIFEKLGVMFITKYWTPMARENLEMAVERNPDNLSAWTTLLMVYVRMGDSDKILKTADTILEKDPDNIYALMNLSTWYNDQGRHDEALEYLARARKRDPKQRSIYTKILWSMLSASSASALDILEVGRALDDNVLKRLRRANDFAERDRNPERKLRIGWLSSDMRTHPVAAFIWPFLEHIDHGKLETFIYYNFSEEDQLSHQIKGWADQWRVVHDIGDESLADLIEGDEIDILIDLNGYTDGCRVEVVARKPAPIQVTWLGFPGTSGLSAIDYIFIPPDPVLEKGNYWSSETPWPLPDCYGVRGNISDNAIEAGLPCERRQAPFTFACFNHFRKASEKTIELWSRILVQLPEARLILVAMGSKDNETIQYFSDKFGRYGVKPEQLDFRGYVVRQQYYENYNEVDLGLDPFPFNGGTTGYDSIWMGVPFVTLPGEHLSARMGKTILENVGLHELVAESADDYVNIAVALANDHERLKRLRAGLRERMAESPLLDGPRMARSLEDAFRGMWRRWCEGQGSSTGTCPPGGTQNLDHPLLRSTMEDGTLRIRITNKCNAKCRYCGQLAWPREVQEMSMRREILYEYMRPVYEKISVLLLTGGDPLAAREGLPFARFMNENYPQVNLWLETNGIVFREEWQRLAMNNLMKVHVSVNGSNEEVFRKGCWEGGGVAYRKLTRNIRDYMARLGENGLEVFAPDVSMVINRDTASDVLDFVKYALTERLMSCGFYFDYTENNMAGDYFGYPEISRPALYELMKLERVLAGKFVVYFRLWVPLKEVGMMQPEVDAIPMDELEEEYADILALAKDRSVKSEYEARVAARRRKGKKLPGEGSTLQQMNIQGRDICFAPFRSLDISPAEKFECCGWIAPPRFNLRASVRDGSVNWDEAYNTLGMRKKRKDRLEGNYDLCQKCCPLIPKRK